MDTLQTQLQSVVYASGSPRVFCYTIQNLGKGVPSKSPWSGALQSIRLTLFTDLVRMSRGLQPLYAPQGRFNPGQAIPGQAIPRLDLLLQKQWERRQQLLLREQLGELLGKLKDRKEFLNGLFQEMMHLGPDELKSRLADKEPDIRLVAVMAVADRRLHFEETLIDLLNDDPAAEVQAAAHQALVRLSRGNDFGPAPNAAPAARVQSIRAWQQWLLWQEIPGQPSPQWLARNFRSGSKDLQDWLLAQLSDWPREDGPSLLANTIPLLAAVVGSTGSSPGAEAKQSATTNAAEVAAMQEQLRRALAHRLSRLRDEALDRCLTDNDVEIRRAAATACALRKDTRHLPALVAALQDQEAAVAQAAHEALRELTGQDFGPSPGADAAAIESATLAWLRWAK
jgi:hypothetical protein